MARSRVLRSVEGREISRDCDGREKGEEWRERW